VLVHRAIPTDPAVRASSSLFLTETKGQSGTASRKLLFSGLSPAASPIALRMGVEEGTQLLTRRRLMAMDGVPIRLAVSYFRPDIPEAADLSGDAFLEGGLQELFDRHGRTFGRAEETLVARMPSPEEAGLLAIQPDEPVAEIVRTSFDDSGEPVHTLQTICAASRHVFVIRQRPEDRVF